MNVLSLFDGMSCGRLALERSGIKVDNYYASEIDKYAIQVTRSNWPATIHLGDVTKIDTSKLPKIDLLIGGSPCQSFSFAGKRKGMSTTCEEEILTLDRYLELKEQGFEFEGQSYLFWEFMRIKEEVKPDNFLLENVVMSEKWELILSKAIGFRPIKICSSLVSAQSRKRLYWTSFGQVPAGLFGFPTNMIPQPKDRGLLLKDVLQESPEAKYYVKNPNNNKRLKQTLEENEITETCLVDSYNKVVKKDKSITISTRVNAANNTHIAEKYYMSDKLIAYLVSVNKLEKQHKGLNQKSLCCTATMYKGPGNDGMTIVGGNRLRKLTPIECERLQTVPDNYTNFVSDTQRYRMLGNGWTIDVITHLLSYLD